ncbi:MAG TPA: aspartate aminotransferase family protein [Verrucomicrobiae bacterium]|nr:aspartate aminotransferase family protein [Verrucomicrobiae bacterium]
MNRSEILALYDRYVVPSYARYPHVFVRGKGARVWDADGREYLDFGGGIAVNLLGHAALAGILAKQADILVHCSNLYYTEPQGVLAKRLVELVGSTSLTTGGIDGKPATAGKCFFCNSGGEANEALFKLARKFGNEGLPAEASAKADGVPRAGGSAGASPSQGGRYEILTFENSFHGRTLAGISATGQEKVKHGFEPPVDGFRHVPFNDLDAVAKAVGPKTVAILTEAIQGESGVRLATAEFLRGLRRLCDERKLLLMFDEVQCGMGRTGEFCGFRAIASDVQPDAISWAKGLGGGFPIAAIWVRGPYADVLGPGSHGTTFGGTPLACSVALAVLETLERDGLRRNAREVGEYFIGKLRGLAAKCPAIRDVRGLGLMIGIELTLEARPAVLKLAEHGLIGIAAGTNVVRFLPPLNITRAEVDEAMEKLGRALTEGGST